ncbi:unnamed protein product [Callosobruchus maculatus]|uniref:Ethylmalonyl-CoA decarboxylase n=1 Tax=Callosobruchus maculatus TaxID=64391 RepID=A0A653DPI9_CALMS|nr:unnamed protein product [Callosobruchus maculatus]
MNCKAVIRFIGRRMDRWKNFTREFGEVSHYRDTSIEDMETALVRYKGGEVILSKEYWDEGIAIIYLNHPEKKNAISGKMMVDLRKCLTELESFKAGKAVILTSKGDNFCSGGDLDFARASGTPQEGFFMSTIMHNVLKKFRKLPLVSVSLIHGPTLGGGAELSVFPDFLLAADNVKLGFVQGKLGIMTPWGGTTRLRQIMGERKALQLLLASKVFSAEEGLQLGLVSKIVNTTSRLDEALDYVRQLTIHHSSIVRAYKTVTSHYDEEQFDKSLMLERELFHPMWGSELNKKALDKNIKHVNVKNDVNR